MLMTIANIINIVLLLINLYIFIAISRLHKKFMEDYGRYWENYERCWKAIEEARKRDGS
jgi:hypothetical protein